MPAVLRMTIHKNPCTSQSLFVIPMLVQRHSQVDPKFCSVLRRAPKLITITPILLLYQSSGIPLTPVPVIKDPSYSEGLLEYTSRVWYSPEIDAAKFTLRILSDTPGVFQRLKYILLMFVTNYANKVQFSDVIRFIEGAVNAPPEPWWMTAVMLHWSMYLTASLSTHTSCTWSRNWTLLMVCHGYHREWAE
jgi:hypothetical protein